MKHDVEQQCDGASAVAIVVVEEARAGTSRSLLPSIHTSCCCGSRFRCSGAALVLLPAGLRGSTFGRRGMIGLKQMLAVSDLPDWETVAHNYHGKKEIGRGTFGRVHRYKILDDQQRVLRIMKPSCHVSGSPT